jgi:hypothetical protein
MSEATTPVRDSSRASLIGPRVNCSRRTPQPCLVILTLCSPKINLLRERGWGQGPKRQRDRAKSGFYTALAKVLRQLPPLSGTSGRFDRHPRDAEPSDRRAGLVGSLCRWQGRIPVCGDETLAVHRLGRIGQEPEQRWHHDGGP